MSDLFPNRPAPLPRTGILAPDGGRYVWGPIQRIHEIGDFAIVEYLNDSSGGGPSMWAEHGATRFHPYVNGKDSEFSRETLDEALVCAVAFKRLGDGAVSGMAEWAFERMTQPAQTADK